MSIISYYDEYGVLRCDATTRSNLDKCGTGIFFNDRASVIATYGAEIGKPFNPNPTNFYPINFFYVKRG